MSDQFPAMPSGLPAEFETRFEQLQRELEDVQERIAAMEETAYSPDRTVAATVGAGGQLKQLQLDPRIYRTTDAKALAATITQTVQEAAEVAARQLVELTQPLNVGASSPDSAAATRAGQSDAR